MLERFLSAPPMNFASFVHADTASALDFARYAISASGLLCRSAYHRHQGLRALSLFSCLLTVLEGPALATTRDFEPNADLEHPTRAVPARVVEHRRLLFGPRHLADRPVTVTLRTSLLRAAMGLKPVD